MDDETKVGAPLQECLFIGGGLNARWELIREPSETLLAPHFPTLSVSVDSAFLTEGGFGTTRYDRTEISCGSKSITVYYTGCTKEEVFEKILRGYRG